MYRSHQRSRTTITLVEKPKSYYIQQVAQRSAHITQPYWNPEPRNQYHSLAMQSYLYVRNAKRQIPWNMVNFFLQISNPLLLQFMSLAVLRMPPSCNSYHVAQGPFNGPT